jgi:hypothetical protein
MGFADARLIAARMYSFADRRNGQLRMATRELGAETVGRCLVVTDSVNDLEVLQSCARPLRTVWPHARYREALGRVYLPGEYISRVKRPGMRYILGGILKEDFAFWVLSSIGLATNPASHLVGLLLLLLSFWAIYERGYVDNDLVASRYEADPKLSATFGIVRVATPAVQPWIWALLAGAAAILHPDRIAFVVHFACWVAVLISMYGCFLFYNRLDKKTRVWLYPLLQFARGAAFTVIVPIEPAGVAALGAHVLSRWGPYQIYRQTSAGWPNAQPELVGTLPVGSSEQGYSVALAALLPVFMFSSRAAASPLSTRSAIMLLSNPWTSTSSSSVAPCGSLASSSSAWRCSGLRRCFRGSDGIGNSALSFPPPHLLITLGEGRFRSSNVSVSPAPTSGICCTNHRQWFPDDHLAIDAPNDRVLDHSVIVVRPIPSFQLP